MALGSVRSLAVMGMQTAAATANTACSPGGAGKRLSRWHGYDVGAVRRWYSNPCGSRTTIAPSPWPGKRLLLTQPRVPSERGRPAARAAC
jgi:hypothetical protein